MRLMLDIYSHASANPNVIENVFGTKPTHTIDENAEKTKRSK